MQCVTDRGMSGEQLSPCIFLPTCLQCLNKHPGQSPLCRNYKKKCQQKIKLHENFQKDLTILKEKKKQEGLLNAPNLVLQCSGLITDRQYISTFIAVVRTGHAPTQRKDRQGLGATQHWLK